MDRGLRRRFLVGPSAWARDPAWLVPWSGASPAVAAAWFDRLCAAIGAGTGPSRVHTGPDGVRLALCCPLPELGEVLIPHLEVLVARARDESVLDEALLAGLSAWEANPEAARAWAAARAARVPAAWLPGVHGLILGLGARSHVLVGGHLEPGGPLRDLLHDKLSTARLLQAAGIPCAETAPAPDVDAALAARARSEGPVVIKPRRGWAQVGVQPGLDTEAQVRAGFARAHTAAAELGGGLVVERHHAGTYVRATLVGGRLGAACAGAAPEAVGDGRRTAWALAEAAWGSGPGAPFTARARGLLEAVLAAQDLAPASIPAEGVRFAVGFPGHGSRVDITAQLHARTRALLARVGRLFPAPLLGVDLLVADPRGPFGAAGDVVLEVNGGPGFAEHDDPVLGTPRDLAPALVAVLRRQGGGLRVPVVGAPAGGAGALEALGEALRAEGLSPAGVTRGRVWVGRPACSLGPASAAPTLRLQTEADVLLLELDDAIAEAVGLPVDRIDRWLGAGSRRPAWVPTGRLSDTRVRRALGPTA